MPPAAFADFNVKHMFPTPFIMASFSPDEGQALNQQLIPMLLKKAEESGGVKVSNAGGWQSDAELPVWGGPAIDRIIAALKDCLFKVTLYMHDKQFDRVHIDWKINGWANISRKGHSNVPHTHPGAYWSAVYYVQCDEPPEKPIEKTTGGELELFDPRGSLPTMYCPILRIGVQNYLTAGGSELHRPKAGQCVIFPSWLSHAVKPYDGEGTRISLAFNFSI